MAGAISRWPPALPSPCSIRCKRGARVRLKCSLRRIRRLPRAIAVPTKYKLQKWDTERLRSANNPGWACQARLIELWQNERPGQFPTLHDPLAVAVAFLPGLVETRLGSVQVETNSALTNGITMFTPADRPPKGQIASTQVARHVHATPVVGPVLTLLAAPPWGRY